MEQIDKKFFEAGVESDEESCLQANADGKDWANDFKKKLLEGFSEWLEKQDLNEVNYAFYKNETDSSQVDLFTLFSELTALKQESKIVSRQFKTVMDRLEEKETGLQIGLEVLKKAHFKTQKEMEYIKGFFLRLLFQGILDIRDRIEEGIKAAEKAKSSSSWLVKIKRGHKDIERLIEGQKITLRHMDKLLSSYGISSIETVGRNFDPFTMMALEVEMRKDKDDGIVTEEIRKGFLLKEGVLRPAEVKVNKWGPATSRSENK